MSSVLLTVFFFAACKVFFGVSAQLTFDSMVTSRFGSSQRGIKSGAKNGLLVGGTAVAVERLFYAPDFMPTFRDLTKSTVRLAVPP